jgi:hypothetical protein
MLNDFSKNYAAKYKKPFVLSETASAYTINLDNHKPNSGGDSDLKIKSTWVKDLLSAATAAKLQGFIWVGLSPARSTTRLTDKTQVRDHKG